MSCCGKCPEGPIDRGFRCTAFEPRNHGCHLFIVDRDGATAPRAGAPGLRRGHPGALLAGVPWVEACSAPGLSAYATKMCGSLVRAYWVTPPEGPLPKRVEVLGDYLIEKLAEPPSHKTMGVLHPVKR
jgi:hypothetical protein